jgi:hypothetical protein
MTTLLSGPVLAVALALGLSAAPAALGDAYLGSSSLLGPVTTVPEPTAIDTVYWLTALANGNPFRVSKNGQILQFSVRGHTDGPSPAPIHFQVLRPAGARLKIVASSQAFPLPVTDGVWSFNPVNFCVRAGDYVGFNTEGGPNLDVFAPITGSTTQRYAANFGTMNGDFATPTALPNIELLMSAFEGTGGHASPLCGGIAGIELHVAAQSLKVGRSGSTTVPLLCTGPEPCSGSLRLSAGDTLLATGSFSLASRGQRALPLTLSPAGRRLLRAHRAGLTATVTAILGTGPDDSVSSALRLVG